MSSKKTRRSSKKQINKNSVKKQITLVLFAILGFVGLANYRTELKPIINIVASTLADVIIKSPSITGNVLRVSDGDTFTLIDNDNNEVKVRLYGVDAPEISQPFGVKSKDYLESLIIGQNVSIEILDTDRYGRYVAIATVGDMNINELMLKYGYAWYYETYCKKSFCKSWQSIQSNAQNAKLGIWSKSNNTPPWEHRNAQKN